MASFTVHTGNCTVAWRFSSFPEASDPRKVSCLHSSLLNQEHSSSLAMMHTTVKPSTREAMMERPYKG